MAHLVKVPKPVLSILCYVLKPELKDVCVFVFVFFLFKVLFLTPPAIILQNVE